MAQIGREPVFFKRNRVFRVYKGGALFHDLMGDAQEDSYYPEEWIASAVRAINEGHDDPYEGISVTEDGMLFSQLIEQYPREMLGDRENPGVLVKFLDSAIRLPMQAHPTRAFSMEHFGSPYGKAEAWLILATRPDACIYFGFSRSLTRGEFSAAIDDSEVNPEAMTAFVNRCPVRTGDVFFVPAGVIHAIGAGCLILEVQEPTDFTIQPERWCGEYRLSDEAMYMGLDRETAIDCFDFTRHGRNVLEDSRRHPVAVETGEGYVRYQLIGPETTECFSMERLCVSGGTYTLAPGAIYIVTEGSGTLTGENYARFIGRGEYFFLPAMADGIRVTSEAGIELIRCAGGK
ncbi:MAG: class I mannose-6-phosphate isomerase [Clostridia bacterium]|nr:class I mannose-6-phosphate isomerase [Clostridia bacterium]